MYPSGVVQPGSSNAVGGLLTTFVTGGLIGVLILAVVFFLACYLSYRIIRTAVRDGIVDAHRKTGGLGSSSGRPYVNGWPPDQQGAAPAAPTYRSPNG